MSRHGRDMAGTGSAQLWQDAKDLSLPKDLELVRTDRAHDEDDGETMGRDDTGTSIDRTVKRVADEKVSP